MFGLGFVNWYKDRSEKLSSLITSGAYLMLSVSVTKLR